MAMLQLVFRLPTVTSVWTKQRLSEAVSREEVHRTVNCGFSFKYFGLTVWKECKGPHLFHSLGPTLHWFFTLFLPLVSLEIKPHNKQQKTLQRKSIGQNLKMTAQCSRCQYHIQGISVCSSASLKIPESLKLLPASHSHCACKLFFLFSF